MRGFKRSPLCSNCGRDKRLVTPSLADYPSWLKLPYCEECASRQCRDITQFEPCPERQAVRSWGEHPAHYLGYCAKHWAVYGLCPGLKGDARLKGRCGEPKEVWMPVCWQCHGKAEAARLKKLAKLQRQQEREARAIRAKLRRKSYRYKELKQ